MKPDCLHREGKRTTDTKDTSFALHIVIFSKDRACQLHSLLESIRDNLRVPVRAIRVLYRCSTRDFERGYERLMSHEVAGDVSWRREQDFAADLIEMLGELDDRSLVMFLVDDDTVFRPFKNAEVLTALSPRHLFVSLRCSRSYEKDIPPRFIRTTPYLEWKWNYHRRKPVSWNYPFSLDGNVFRVSIIRRIVAGVEFSAPNSLEARMHTYRHKWWIKRIGRALAPLAPAVVNNPLNRVQVEGQTWHRNVSPERLNSMYLDGYSIDNRVLYRAELEATHSALPLELAQHRANG